MVRRHFIGSSYGRASLYRCGVDTLSAECDGDDERILPHDPVVTGQRENSVCSPADPSSAPREVMAQAQRLTKQQNEMEEQRRQQAAKMEPF